MGNWHKTMDAVTSQTTGSIFPLDYGSRYGCKYAVTVIVDGTNTSTVQFTNDDIQDASVTPTWHSHDTLVDLTATTTGNIEYNPTAIRLNVTAYTGGSATLQITKSA